MAEFLNRNIKYLRTIKGISQQELAQRIGIDRATISRIENNKIETTVDNAIKIAKTLNIPLYDLVGRDLQLKNPPTKEENQEKYKIILRKKGLLDENDNIDEEKIDDLLKIAKLMNDYNKKGEKKDEGKI